jgi:hypothetical protein
VHPKEQEAFSLDKLTGQRYFRVLRVLKRVAIHQGMGESVTLEYDEGELANPGADPLIIGTITKTVVDGNNKADYQPRVLWNDRLWQSLDEGSEAMFQTMMGIKASDVKKFAERLRQHPALRDGEGSSIRLFPAVGRGTEEAVA